MMASLGRLALALLVVAASASAVSAQGNTFNPFGNSGYADYREFASPSYGINPSLPGQARLDNVPLITRPRANTFQEFTESLEDETSPNFDRGSTSRMPYFEAYRRYDRQFRPGFKPKEEADKEFAERYKKRQELYQQIMAERDPLKRTKLLREYRSYSLDRPVSAPKARPEPDSKTKPARPGAPSTGRAANAYLPSTRRRATSPSPYSRSDRANTLNPTPRAPAPPTTTRPATSPDPALETPTEDSTLAVPPPR